MASKERKPMEKAATALFIPKAPKTVFMIVETTMALEKLVSRLYAIISSILLCLLVTSCDEPYVPKEQRLTFAECQEIFVDLQAFVRETYLQTNNSIVIMSEMADNWSNSNIGEKHRYFEEILNICAFKQFAAKKSGEYIGPDYGTADAALTTISLSIQAFGSARRGKTGPKELERRLSLIKSMAIKIAEAKD